VVHRRLVALSVAACVAVPSLLLAACGDDEGASTYKGRANPVPGTALAPGDFANLPKPGSARPVDDPTETKNAITQSFMVTGMGPLGVIGYYAQLLPADGWLPVRVERVGPSTMRSYWRRDDERLEVTAFAEDGVTSNGPTQLDLLLRLQGSAPD
jgi:hypothetical protein